MRASTPKERQATKPADVDPQPYDPRAEARARRAGKRLAALSVFCGTVALLLAVFPATRFAGAGFCALGLFLGITTVRRVRNRGGGGRELAIAGIVLGGLAAAGFLASAAAFSSVLHHDTEKPSVAVKPTMSASELTKKVLDEQLRVEIGTFSLGLDPSGILESTLTVMVTNKTDDRHSFDIKLEAISPKGKKLTEDSAYIVNLEGGQTANVAVFKIVNNELAPQLKNADFKVIEAVSY